MKDAIVAWLRAHRHELKRTYAELHALAEVSWQEYKTTAYLQQVLDEIGIEYERFPTHTGLVAHWHGSMKSAYDARENGTVIALRTDIDALWQQVDGALRANHSCGHDAHMTMVLYALQALRAIGFQPAGELRILFQPAEETGEGALKLLEAGCLNDVDYVLGIHLRPDQELVYGQASGAIYHGACAVLEGIVTGRQAHAARPKDGLNAIEMLADIVQAVKAVSSGESTGQASCKVTKLHVPNESSNIIPDYGAFTIDVRAQTNEAMDALLPKLSAAVHAVGKAYGSAVELQSKNRMVAARPNPYLEALVGGVITELLGDAGLARPPVTPGGEDFHFYPLRLPELRATMIGLGCGLHPGLHHPQMRFQSDALETGAAILALSVVRLHGPG
ncbi:amidohydrolase [Paenibacillus methanolicus]|uniref:Amidohydrolase n=1 Tax=Paenibacillus methanolicus TaxID=582686 RepID=A0A5S5CBC4_9BACL|nr:amidohydrolase [Paenibacillus methanolicus]TYP76627.1 amidohydrolase [Paenibacillus methanolicus]